jgi:ActR/RegA family two-component response regulator
MRKTKRAILVVDKDQANARALFAALVRAGHSVTDSFGAEQAAGILQERSFDVAIVDVLTSRHGDIDLLELLRKDWSQPKIIAMADFSSLAVQKRVVSRGAHHYVDKPVDMDTVVRLVESTGSEEAGKPMAGSADDRDSWPSQDARSFSGQVQGVDILEYLQFMMLTGKQTVVEVTSQSGCACRLFLRDGNVVHAQSNEARGEEAFYHCLGLKGGQFTNLPWVDPPEKTINKPGDFLLFEAARRRDETTVVDS